MESVAFEKTVIESTFNYYTKKNSRADPSLKGVLALASAVKGL